MPSERHFFYRTFGKSWKWTFPLFLILTSLVSIIPSLIFWSDIEFNEVKFSEEWFKNIMAISAIFLTANYLNYRITINRSQDKISMLIHNFNVVGDGIFARLGEKKVVKSEVLNLITVMEQLLKKIQNEDEFLYRTEKLEDFIGQDTYFKALVSGVNSNPHKPEDFDELKSKFENIKKYLTHLL